MFDIAIVMNNYFHDVATAMLLSSALVVLVLLRRAESGGEPERLALARALPSLTSIAWGAIAWIVVGGVPRVIFFKTHEFIPAEVKNLIPALAVKHTLMVVAIVLGAVLWRRANRIAAADAASTPAEEVAS